MQKVQMWKPSRCELTLENDNGQQRYYLFPCSHPASNGRYETYILIYVYVYNIFICTYCTYTIMIISLFYPSPCTPWHNSRETQKDLLHPNDWSRQAFPAYVGISRYACAVAQRSTAYDKLVDIPQETVSMQKLENGSLLARLFKRFLICHRILLRWNDWWT